MGDAILAGGFFFCLTWLPFTFMEQKPFLRTLLWWTCFLIAIFDIGFLGFAFLTSESSDNAELFGLSVTTIFASIVASGLVFWILAAIVTFVRYFVLIPVATVGGFTSSLLRFFRPVFRLPELSGDGREERKRQKELARRMAEEARKAEIAIRQEESNQRRRDDALAQCEVVFSRISPDIAARFSRRDFDAFVKKFMGDNRSPDEVESRRDQLLKLMHDHQLAEKPQPKFRTLEELAVWYATEKAKIANLPLDEESREDQLIQLNRLFAEWSEKVMQEQYR